MSGLTLYKIAIDLRVQGKKNMAKNRRSKLLFDGNVIE